MKQKTEPEQMRLIEETPEEKIAKLRASVRNREALLKKIEKDVKTTKDQLVDFVYDHMEGDEFDYSIDNVAELNSLASEYRHYVLELLQAKAGVGEAYIELAEAERSR